MMAIFGKFWSFLTLVWFAIQLEVECGYSTLYLKMPRGIRDAKQQAPLVDANSIVEPIVQVSKQKENYECFSTGISAREIEVKSTFGHIKVLLCFWKFDPSVGHFELFRQMETGWVSYEYGVAYSFLILPNALFFRPQVQFLKENDFKNTLKVHNFLGLWIKAKTQITHGGHIQGLHQAPMTFVN